MDSLENITVEVGNATSTVIWCHGLGADGHDFEPIVPQLQLSDVRFIFPHAPLRAVTINGGMKMRAWYDIKEMNLRQEEDKDAILDSSLALQQLIEQENSRGIASKNIVLAGFSQGGAIALQAGLSHVEAVAGIMALSTYLPLAKEFQQSKPRHADKLPVFYGHGREDPIVPFALAQQSRQHLEAAGYQVNWQSYPMAHQVCPEEITDIANWLAQVLPLSKLTA